MAVKPPTIAKAAIPAATPIQVRANLVPFPPVRNFSVPSPASVASAKLFTYMMVIGARKNLVPGTIAYTSW